MIAERKIIVWSKMKIHALIRAIVLLMIAGSFSALPAFGACNLADGATVSFTVSPLIDNHESTVTITLTGASSDDYAFSLSAVPVQKGTLINKEGTTITFTETADPLVWETSEVYWYGLDPDDKCYDFVPDYKFTLTATGSETVYTCELEADVSWPNEDPYMDPDISARSGSIVHDAEPVPGIADFYRCLIEFNDYTKSYSFNDQPTTDQYAEETTIEEEYHADQWMGTVSENEGGQATLFTAKGIKWAISWVGAGPWYVNASTAAEAEALAEQFLLTGEGDEETVSWNILSQDRGFIELKAKEQAAYNAAWTYECTYETQYGANPANHEHPAY